MRKLNFVIFLLLLLLFSSQAYACIERSYYYDWLRPTVNISAGLLICWFCISAIYFIIRGIVRCIGKTSNKQNAKSEYFIPALVYMVVCGIILCIVYFDKLNCFIGLYILYVLYVAFICAHQLWNFIKNLKLEKWLWVGPIVPFYMTIISMIIRNINKVYDITFYLCLFIFLNIATAYGIYKLTVSKTSKHQIVNKIVWGLLLATALAYNAYLLYSDITHVEPKDYANDCI